MAVFVNESNAKALRVDFSFENEPSEPSTVHWNCWSEGTELQADTALSVDTEVDDLGNVVSYYVQFVVPGSVNAIQDDSKDREIRKVLVIANKGTDTEKSVAFEYWVKNLKGRS